MPEDSSDASKNGSKPPEIKMIDLNIVGPIAPNEVSALCERAQRLLDQSGADLIVCNVSLLPRPDVAAVEALARIQLLARGCGCEVVIRSKSSELSELLELLGLTDVLPIYEQLPVQVRRQSEQGKESSGVEEESDASDLSI